MGLPETDAKDTILHLPSPAEMTPRHATGEREPSMRLSSCLAIELAVPTVVTSCFPLALHPRL